MTLWRKVPTHVPRRLWWKVRDRWRNASTFGVPRYSARKPAVLLLRRIALGLDQHAAPAPSHPDTSMRATVSRAALTPVGVK